MQSEDLPEVIELPVPFAAYVYPNPGDTTGGRISGHGLLTLGLASRGPGEPAEVRLEDIEVTLHPSQIPFDVDGDGELEVLEIPAARLGPEMFDLDASRGTYEPETGAFEITFVVQIASGSLATLVGEGLRFEVTERGTLDFENGRVETRVEPLTLSTGPLEGLTFINCGGGDVDPLPCYAALAMGVIVANGSFSGSAGQAPKKVHIAPYTPVRVLWEATNAPQVEITPEIGRRGPLDSQKLPDWPKRLSPITRDANYNGKTLGGECKQASGLVEIDVCLGGETLAQTAPFNDSIGWWNTHLAAHTYDPNLRVDAIMISSHHSDAVTHVRWKLDHIPATGGLPNGTTIVGHDHWTPLSKIQELPGEYRFYPMPPGTSLSGAEKSRTIYFHLRIAKLP